MSKRSILLYCFRSSKPVTGRVFYIGKSWHRAHLIYRTLHYLFKLQCIEGPQLLLDMVPTREEVRGNRPRTRSLLRMGANDNGHRLTIPSSVRDRNGVLRSFPNCILPIWNSLPSDAFGMEGGMCIENMQKFKVYVHNWLLERTLEWRLAHRMITEVFVLSQVLCF